MNGGNQEIQSMAESKRKKDTRARRNGVRVPGLKWRAHQFEGNHLSPTKTHFSQEPERQTLYGKPVYLTYPVAGEGLYMPLIPGAPGVQQSNWGKDSGPLWSPGDEDNWHVGLGDH
jgi:hypothetical protein